MGQNLVLDLSLEFGVSIVKYCELLQEQRKFVIANQLMRCGTSIGANIYEAQHAESRQDFIHKMKIALKEANETLYWLSVIERMESYPKYDELKGETEKLVRIISKLS